MQSGGSVMPGNPSFDEEAGVRALETPVTMDSIPLLQHMALAVATDLYDRKVTREYFMTEMGRCFGLYATLAKLYVANSILTEWQGEVGPDPQRLTNSRDWLLGLSTKKRDEVHACLQRLSQCPWSEDVLH